MAALLQPQRNRAQPQDFLKRIAWGSNYPASAGTLASLLADFSGTAKRLYNGAFA